MDKKQKERVKKVLLDTCGLGKDSTPFVVVINESEGEGIILSNLTSTGQALLLLNYISQLPDVPVLDVAQEDGSNRTTH